jgi:hypothetical protein
MRVEQDAESRITFEATRSGQAGGRTNVTSEAGVDAAAQR